MYSARRWVPAEASPSYAEPSYAEPSYAVPSYTELPTYAALEQSSLHLSYAQCNVETSRSYA